MQNEASKTKSEQAEDIAYTINHSLYCTLTDFLNPPINAATDGYLRWLIPGCGHDHSHADGHDHHDRHHHGPECSHHHHEHPPASRWQRVTLASKQAFSRERFIQYAKGEFIGDFGAVPLTIGVQRLFPGVMRNLRTFCEPIVGRLFRWGIDRNGKEWARRQGVDLDSAPYKNHVAQVYDYEMEHFPQAVLWTGFSLGLNTAYQLWADKSHIPFNRKLVLKSTSVLSGVLVTAGAVVAARVSAPEGMHSVDRWTSRNAILPTTKAAGKLFGIRNKDIEHMAEAHTEIQQRAWRQRIEEDQKPVQVTL